jgi:hypothetical protein
MLTRASYRQPTLTQMKFVSSKGPARRTMPKGWQRHDNQVTGDPLYVHALTGRIVYRYEDILKKISTFKPVTPVQAPAAAAGPVPDEAISGVDMFSTPRRFKDGSSTKPIELDDDEQSDTLSDLTNTQMTLKSRKRIFTRPNRRRVPFLAKRATSMSLKTWR